MEGNRTEATNFYRYDPLTNDWQEQVAEDKDAPAVLIAHILWGKREGAYAHPTGLKDQYFNPAYHDFDWSYFHTSLRQWLIWCPEHRCFEKIHHLEHEDSIRSVSGCRIRGKVACFTMHIDISYPESAPKSIHAPLGWILQQHRDGSTEIQAELLHIPMTINIADFSISLGVEDIENCRLTIGENFQVGEDVTKFSPCGKDWSDFALDIPSNVTEKAISYLLSAAGDKAYIPSDSNTEGYRKLRAFSRRPEDLHIEYWREIIGEKFDGLFPKKQKNPFLALCRYLEIVPTSKLTEGYEKNPFAPLWAVLLRSLGFKEEDNIAKFYALTKFAGIAPEHFSIFHQNEGYYARDFVIVNDLSCDIYVSFERKYSIYSINSADGKVEYDEEHAGESALECPQVQGYLAESILLERFYDLVRYVKWALTETSEANFASRGLFLLASRPWTEEIYDEIRQIWYFTDDTYLSPEERKPSPMARKHLLGNNQKWHSCCWKLEHEETMREIEKMSDLWEERDLAKTEAEWDQPENMVSSSDEDNADLSRTVRILAAYDSMLLGNKICSHGYPVPSMLGRDMKILRKFDPTISYRPRNGQYEIENVTERYREETDVESLPDQSRKIRLLAYIRFLYDRGYLSRSIADQLNGKILPRRTFVRDLSILRRAFPEKELVYHAKDKRYVWKEVDENESH